jgi:integrase
MPSRSRLRRGYIEPLLSGSFRAVVFVGIDPLTRRRRYVRETRETRPEAEKELTRLQRDVDLNRQVKSAITVAEAIEQWMAVAELEETTRDRYEDLIASTSSRRSVT